MAWIAPVMILLAGGMLVAKTKFNSVWKSPEAAGTRLAGQKVAALIIDPDESLRVSGEEALARELTERGMQGVPSYRFVPKEELKSAEQAKGWFERAGVQAVVALRVVSDDTKLTYTPATWTSTYYSSLWGYYGYGWGVMYDPGYKRIDRYVSLETLIFSVPKNQLLWAGVSETENPKAPAKVIEEVVREAVSEMRKQGLVRK